jgi:hypothetical protein
MKRAGLAPPKRKCSCDSGITVQRDRKSACAPAANERSSDPLGFGDGLQDRDEPNSYQEIELVGGQVVTALGENPEAAEFWSFDDQITTASQDIWRPCCRAVASGKQ